MLSRTILIAGIALSLLAGCGQQADPTANAAAPIDNAAKPDAAGVAATPAAASADGGPLPGDAALLAGPDRPAPRVIDIRGVRIGMSVDQARAAYRASGLPAIEQDPASSRPGAWTFVFDQRYPDQREDLEFVSSIVSRRLGSGNARPAEILVSVFTPLRGREHVWAIGDTRRYTPEEMPSVANTLAALREKYGAWNFDTGVDPSRDSGAMLLWYWNDAGQPGSPALQETCRSALHNTYFLNQVNDGGTLNVAARQPDRLRAGIDAGCSKVIRVFITWNSDAAVTELTIETVDLKAGFEAGTELTEAIAGREAAEASVRREAASRNRPTL
jgi:hypothetical protein